MYSVPQRLSLYSIHNTIKAGLVLSVAFRLLVSWLEKKPWKIIYISSNADMLTRYSTVVKFQVSIQMKTVFCSANKKRNLIQWLDLTFMSLVSHKKSYLVCAELSKLQILFHICLFSSSCICPLGLLAVSVLYLREYSKIRQFDTY